MPRTPFNPDALPSILQGGMGVAVSSWELARAVASAGEIGVISGTAIDSVVVRELQDGDPYNRRAVLADYPDQEIAEHLIDRYYNPEGRAENQPYKLLPIHRFNPSVKSQRVLAAATYTEIRLAQQGHTGLIGINLMAKLKRYTLPCLYGAMLADVDIACIGAGIPMEEARAIRALAKGEATSLRLDVDTSQCDEPADTYTYDFDPADVLSPPPQMEPPAFFPIVSSDTLARILHLKLPEEFVQGWVIEEPLAGGHNAPPRSKEYDEDGTPIYGERDKPNYDRVKKLGKPFYLAGGYGSPEGLAIAESVGATGIQVGSLFSLADESGYPKHEKHALIRGLHTGEVRIRTDGMVSPTGFPFKVLTAPQTLGIPEQYQQRERICDLGYLRTAYVDKKGRIFGRCPAEPVDDYVRKGGDVEDTEGRACLCNALLANVGHAQQRDDEVELRLYTGGDTLLNLPLGSADDPQYTADDVLAYLKKITEPVPA